MHVTIRKIHLAITALLATVAAAGSYAADNSRNGVAAADQADVQELDEIMVRGTRVRDAIATAEDEFFVLYNSLNKDDDYSASCVYIPIGDTQIRSHLCIPGFMADALADQLYFAEQCRASESDGAALPCYTPPTPQQVLNERSRSYANNLMKLIKSDDRLGRMAGNLDKLYLELASIQKQYVTLKTERATAGSAQTQRAQ